jgi:hypothetical protein
MKWNMRRVLEEATRTTGRILDVSQQKITVIKE